MVVVEVGWAVEDCGEVQERGDGGSWKCGVMGMEGRRDVGSRRGKVLEVWDGGDVGPWGCRAMEV